MFSSIPVADNFTATVEQTFTFQKKLAQSAVELQAIGIEAAITYQLIWLDNYFDNLSILLVKDPTENQIL